MRGPDKYLVFEVVIFAESIPRPGVSWAAAAAGVLMLGAKSLLRSAAAAAWVCSNTEDVIHLSEPRAAQLPWRQAASITRGHKG